MRATFITLAIEDGADPEILETRVTHTRKSRNAFDGYNRGLHWERTCAELSELRIARPARLGRRAADRRVGRPRRPVARYTARYSPGKW